MSTTTRILVQFKKAVAGLRKDLPEMLLPDLEQLAAEGNYQNVNGG
jgi:hypothetical protein